MRQISRTNKSCGCDRDPVHAVRIEPSADNPLSLTVTIELANHVASCCVNADEAFVEFYGGGRHVHSAFEFRESRPSHRFIARATVLAGGLYSYRIFAKILGHTLNREGTYSIS